jgi:hypothetical protein
MNTSRKDLVRLALAAAACGIEVVSCGGNGSSGGGGAAAGPSSGGVAGDMEDASDATVGLFGGDSGAGPGDVGDGGAACASSFEQAHALPLMLVFMFDRSGSMSDLESSDGGPKESKWQACIDGLHGFFGDPSSAGISASLQFFMLPDECDVDGYAAPQVPMTALPAQAVFDQAFQATEPDGETPTVPALEGALAFATQTEQGNPGAKVAVVFVTDGEPNGCDSTIAKAATAAAAGWKDGGAGTPTYVIGIGKVKSLDQIAEAGGTNEAFIVATGNPSQTASDFSAALAVIRGSSLGCEYPIPLAPAGQGLDFGAVNVVFTPSGGAPVTVPYDKDCTGPNGWRYDDAAHPTKIEMCPTGCATVQGDVRGSIALELGCATVGNLR